MDRIQRLKHHRKLDPAVENVVRSLGFTRRQMDVVRLTMVGLSEVEIVEKLGIRQATLRTHKRTIYLGTNARNQFELVTMINRLAINEIREELEQARNGVQRVTSLR